VAEAHVISLEMVKGEHQWFINTNNRRTRFGMGSLLAYMSFAKEKKQHSLPYGRLYMVDSAIIDQKGPEHLVMGLNNKHYGTSKHQSVARMLEWKICCYLQKCS
jgi:hypothetical protein